MLSKTTPTDRTALVVDDYARQRHLLVAVAGAGVLVAVLLQLIATRRGVGLQEDSAAYIGAARGLLHGKGLTLPFGESLATPLTRYPPFYPLLLAGHAITPLDVFGYARWLNTGLLAATLILVALICRTMSRSAAMPLAFASLIVVGSTRFITVYAMAMSEPVMIVAGLASLYLLMKYLADARPHLLYCSATLASLAALTRYIGVAYGVAGAILLARSRKQTRHRRATLVGAYLVGSLGPLAAFVLYNVVVTHDTANRSLGFHPSGLRNLSRMLDTLGSWLVGTESSAQGIAGLVLCVTLVAAVAALIRRGGAHRATAVVLVVWLVVYLVLVELATAIVDATTAGDYPRILTPALPVVAVLLASALHQLMSMRSRLGRLRLALPIACVVALAPIVPEAVRWGRSARINGVAVTRPAWASSRVLRTARETPRGEVIYSNDAAMVYLLTGRHVFDVPSDRDVSSLRRNSEFDAQLARMRRRLARRGGIVVYFDNAFTPTRRQLTDALRLREVVHERSGTVLRAARQHP